MHRYQILFNQLQQTMHSWCKTENGLINIPVVLWWLVAIYINIGIWHDYYTSKLIVREAQFIANSAAKAYLSTWVLNELGEPVIQEDEAIVKATYIGTLNAQQSLIVSNYMDTDGFDLRITPEGQSVNVVSTIKTSAGWIRLPRTYTATSKGNTES